MTTSIDTINLNLTEEYQPEWGAAEIDREITCNCMDSDPNGFHRTRVSPRHVRYWTTTAPPSFKYLTTIGAGTKADDQGTVGQFGEGAKLAALVACRNGWDLTFTSKMGRLSFELIPDPDLGMRILHARIDPSETAEGLVVDFIATSDLPNFDKNYLEYTSKNFSTSYPLDNDLGYINSIFVKGIRVCDTPKDSLYSWNFHTVKINRDRSVVDSASLTSAFLRALDDCSHVYPEILEKMLSDGEAHDFWESSVLWGPYTSPTLKVSNAFAHLWAEDKDLSKWLIPSDSEVIQNTIAKASGYSLLEDLPTWLYNAILRCYAGKIKEVSSLFGTLEGIEEVQWPSELKPLKRYFEAIAKCHPANPKVRLFKMENEGTLDDEDLGLLEEHMPMMTAVGSPHPAILIRASIFEESDFKSDPIYVCHLIEEEFIRGLIGLCGKPGHHTTNNMITRFIQAAFAARKTPLPAVEELFNDSTE